MAVGYKLGLYELVEEPAVGLVRCLQPPESRLCAQRRCGGAGVEPARHYAPQKHHAEAHLQLFPPEVGLAQGCLYQSAVYWF